jgi:hypothetical protein
MSWDHLYDYCNALALKLIPCPRARQALDSTVVTSEQVVKQLESFFVCHVL